MLVGALFASVFTGFILVVFIRAISKVDLTNLFKRDGTDEISSTKFWTNVAYCAATMAFLAMSLLNSSSNNLDSQSVIWLIYLGVVASNAVASKWMSLKYNSSTSIPSNATDVTPPSPPVSPPATVNIPVPESIEKVVNPQNKS